VFASTFAFILKKKENFLNENDLPIGFVEVGSLFEAAITLWIPSCGKASLVEHEGVRHIIASQGCSPHVLRQFHDDYHVNLREYHAKLRSLERKSKRLKVPIEDLKQRYGVVLPELHSCQVGHLSLGSPRIAGKRQDGVKDDRPVWIIQAEKALTKYPYSLLFSFLNLVEEQSGRNPLDAWVPVEKVLAWCSRFGLPSVEEQFCPACDECLCLEKFQWEVIILYVLFRLWEALLEWKVFAQIPGPRNSRDVNAYRDRIHRYADILLQPSRARPRSLLDSDNMLDQAIAEERWLRQVIAAEDRHKQECTGRIELIKRYEQTQAKVGFLVETFMSDIVNDRCRPQQKFFFQVQKSVLQAHSVFELCYLQLSQLILKPLDTWVRHLKLCEVPSCGRLFWAPHGHNKRCEEHPRGAVWADKRRGSRKLTAKDR
jgi:hypothetical protein